MLLPVDHVRLAAPIGGEDLPRAHHGDVLGTTEIPKPQVPAARGGCRFAAADGAVRLHPGALACSRPARTAHPGLRVTGIRDYADYAARLEKRGGRVLWDARLPGHRRRHAEDPVGNRPEFPEPLE
ncbi:glyoxalase [Streptomyces sp. NPDC057411]|uniref:glyoxalase n=1 Tax=unclassified Streptomyces TaxID=2593676 RepID=UPI00363CD374